MTSHLFSYLDGNKTRLWYSDICVSCSSAVHIANYVIHVCMSYTCTKGHPLGGLVSCRHLLTTWNQWHFLPLNARFSRIFSCFRGVLHRSSYILYNDWLADIEFSIINLNMEISNNDKSKNQNNFHPSLYNLPNVSVSCLPPGIFLPS